MIFYQISDINPTYSKSNWDMMGMIIRLGPLQVDLLDPSSSGLPTVLQQTAAEFLAFRRRRERFDCKSAWSLSQPGMSSAWQDEWLRLTMLLFFSVGRIGIIVIMIIISTIIGIILLIRWWGKKYVWIVLRCILDCGIIGFDYGDKRTAELR